jgi:hypothetical protein
MQLRTRNAALQKARSARLERGVDTDFELYELISEHPGHGAYKLSKMNGWTVGRTHSSILRLEKKGLISLQRVVEGGRTRLVTEPRRWQEFFTKEELEEMRQPGYFDEVEERARRSTAER